MEDLGAASPYAGSIRFGGPTGPGPVGNAAGQISGNAPSMTCLVSSPHIASTWARPRSRRVDASVEYTHKTASLGDFTFATEATFYSSYLIQVQPNENYFQYAGSTSSNAFANAVGTIPRWRTYSTIDWKDHGFDVLLGYTFVPTVEDTGTGGNGESPAVRVASYQQLDIGIGYGFAALGWSRWLDNLSVRIGVNNAFDYMPPVAPGGVFDTNSDLATYNGAVGRMYYAEAKYKF